MPDCLTGKCTTTPDIWGGTSVDINDLDMGDSSHPNVAPFSGTLLLLNESSDQAPHGAEGHPIYVSKEVAEQRLKTLPGMGINYQTDLTGHNPAKKVGVITEASISGNKVKVKGLLWKKDFPEAVRTFKSNKGRLGMSMELGDVYVRDKDERVWHLEDFHFTGATVLLKNHAAYEGTDLAASRFFVKALAAARSARGIFSEGGQSGMAKEEKKDKGQGQALVSAISAAVAKAVGDAVTTLATKQEETNGKITKALESISSSQEELVKGLHELAISSVDAAAADVDEVAAGGDATDATDATMSSAKDSTDSTDSTDATDGTDATDATDVRADATATDSVDPTNYSDSDQGDDANPGNLNKDAESLAHSKARKGSTQMTPGGKSVDRGIAAKGTVAKSMAAARVIRSLKAENIELKAKNERMANRIQAIEASMERYADRVERKTIAPEISALLEKNGYDVRDLMGSKRRLSVADVDQILANAGVPLEPSMRMAIKNQLTQNGLMDQGEVRRFTN